MKPYADYRESGVEWLGAVPANWTVGNIRRFATMKTGHTPSRSNEDYWQDCTIPWFTLADVWQLRDGTRTYLGDTAQLLSEVGLANSAAELLPAGTVVLSRTASVGFSGIMPRPMATSQDFWNWICGPRLIPEFLLYQFRAMTQQFRLMVQGSTHKTIYQGIAAGMTVLAPPLEDQREIVNFLDRETARIDELVAEQEALISALVERRSGFITHLTDDPRAGLVPLGRVLSRVRQGWSPNCEAVPADGIEEWGVLKTGCVNGGVFREVENKRLPENETPRPELVVHEDEVVMSRASTSELVGSAARVPRDFPRLMLSDLTYGLTVGPALSPAYTAYALSGQRVRAAITSAAKGTSGSMQKLSQRDIKELPIRLPPVEDQQRIVSILDERLARLDLLTSKCRELIAILKERRAALITAAVTGKIDVRAS